MRQRADNEYNHHYEDIIIGIVDYSMGNLDSILNMLKISARRAKVIASATDIERADKLILPGTIPLMILTIVLVFY